MRLHTEIVSYDPAPDDPWRPVATPIYQTATFDQESALAFGRYDYSRSGNPTRDVLESQIARLERGTRAFAFASGLAAITAVTRLLRPGDEIVASDDLYGGTYRLFTKLCEPRGIRVRYFDCSDPLTLAAAIGPTTRLIHLESISNPLQRVADIPAIADLAHRRGVLLSVDNTALSPYLLRPLELGADFAIHSATKHLSGHSDLMAGVVSVRDDSLARELAFIQNAEGAALAPFDCAQLLRGMKTLAIRLDREIASASRIARWLATDGRVQNVRHPTVSDSPNSALLARQTLRGDAVSTLVCFETGDRETSRRVVEGLKLFNLAVSFGGVNSSASLPCAMSHASIPAAERAARALPEDLVRLSVGLEDPQDLMDDLAQALQRANANLQQLTLPA